MHSILTLSKLEIDEDASADDDFSGDEDDDDDEGMDWDDLERKAKKGKNNLSYYNFSFADIGVIIDDDRMRAEKGHDSDEEKPKGGKRKR